MKNFTYKNHKFIKAIIFCLLIVFSLQVMPVAMATDGDTTESSKLQKVGRGIYGTETPPPSIAVMVGVYIRAFLTMLGIVMVIIIVYAGYLWMTAGGDTEQVKKARAYITNGIVGLIITLSAFAITDYVLSRLAESAAGVDAG